MEDIMSKIKRYAYIEVQTSSIVGREKNLVEYRFVSYSQKKKKSFLFEYSQNQKFKNQSGNSFVTNIVPIEFDDISDIAETGVNFQFIYHGKIIHTHIHRHLFTEPPKQPLIIRLKESEVQTIKDFEEEQKKTVIIPTRRRKLTLNERKMLREIFNNPKFPLDMDKITIYENKFLNIDNAITSFGNIHFPPAPSLLSLKDNEYHHYYMDDFTLRSQDGNIPANPSLLVHEVTHAWQYQHANILFTTRALGCQAEKFFSNGILDPYKYTLKIPNDLKKQILDSSNIRGGYVFLNYTGYNPEALATIIEDYYYRFLRRDQNGNLVPDAGVRFTKNDHNNKKKKVDYELISKGYNLKP